MTVQPNQPTQPANPLYAPLVRPTNGYATAALIFGIAGLFLFCLVVPSLVAVLLGHTAARTTKTGQLAGHGQAVAGLILGYVVIAPAAVWLVAAAADAVTGS